MKKKVLVVDDAKFIREFLSTHLAKDYEVYVAKDGKQGVSMFQELCPDVVLLDINMPKMHGVDVLKKIISIDSKARVIMLSAEDSYEVMDDCKNYGAIDYIVKPFGMDSLLQALHVALYDA